MPKIILSLIITLLLSSPAQAHKVVASTWMDGNVIEGEVGLSNGDMALAGTKIDVLNEQGDKIDETQVMEDGLFRYTPKSAGGHTFKINLGAGHVAVVKVSESEWSQNKTNVAPAPDTNAAQTSPAIDTADLEKLIAAAVRQEVQPLRKELAQYKEKNDAQTILGGLGYILGLTGLFFYLQARRQSKKSDPS